MGKKIIIRTATESDFEWIIPELKIFAGQFDSKMNFFGEESYVREILKQLIASHVFSVAVCEERGGLGMVIGYLYPHLFNPKIRTLAETVWWVKQEHRGSRAGLLLLNEFIKQGKERSDVIIFSLQESSKVNDRSLTKKGFIKKEKCYFLGVNNG